MRAFLTSQTGEIFETRLASHVAALRRAIPDAVVTFADAPVDLPLRAGDDLPLKTWWREDDDDDDDGWDAILATLRAYWRSSGPFVGVVGFSQGASVAALLAALVAESDPESESSASEACFASSLEWVVLCAGRVPARGMARLLAGEKIKIRAGSGSTRREEEQGSNLVPRVRSARALVIAGDADEAVPPGASLEFADWFEDAEVWTHAGGHHFPASRRDVDAFVGFIVEGGDATREASGSEDGNEGFEKSDLHPVRHAVEHSPSGPATTEALRDEIEALEAIFGDELETTAPGREFRFAIPSARASLRVALPAAYPAEPPEIVDVRVERADDDSRDDSSKRGPSPRGVSTRGPSPRAPRRIEEGVREAARRAAAEVYPGEPAVYAVVTACREWLEENLVLPSRKSDDDVGDDAFFRASEEHNAPKTRPKTPEGADPADPGSSVPGGQGGGLDRWWESESPPDLASVAAASAEAAAYEAERRAHTRTNVSLANAKGGGPWTFRVGLVGKPSAGKSTFFNAVVQSRGVNDLAGVSDSANDAPPPPARLALTSPRPFTTIEPNLASTLAPVACPCAKFGLETLCAPRTGAEEVRGEHHRLVPVHVKDVAGLVPGAHAGRGRGNAFLNDLCDADVLAHVVDCSGQTDEDGNDVGAPRDDSSNRRRYSPADDVAWVREELHLWIFSNVRRKWRAVRRDPSALRELFTGYHCVAAVADEAMRRAGFFEPKRAQNQKKSPADEPIGRERESPNLHSESSLRRKRTDTTHRVPRESETRVHNSGGARIVSRETILGLAERDLHRLVAHFLRVRFPTVLVLNKMDAEGARAHADAIKRRFPREPTAETVASTREGTRAALRDAVRLKPPALAFPTDELPATVSTGGVDAGGGGFDDGSKSEENSSHTSAAGSNNKSAAGSNNTSAAGSHTSAAGSNKSDGAMRDCLVMKPGSTVWDAFEAWRRSSSSRAAGCDSDSSGAGSGSRRGEFVRAECLDGTRGGARRIARRGEALGDANGVLKFYVNRKARWQGKKVGLTKK